MQLSIREPGSALTHLIAMLLSIGASIPLLIKASGSGLLYLVAMAIFIVSMILLYGASTVYHAVMLSDKAIKKFRKFDHSMIFVLIAGSYTPVCMIVLGGKTGYQLLTIVWTVAIVGITVKMLWITCPKWFSSIIYIAMGWICAFYLSTIIENLSTEAFLWLLAGGLIYTAGGIIYALKLPIFNSKFKYFGSHELFHVFVMAGSFCHFIFMYAYII